ncbi:MAG: sigma-70 family RNA polymerase sigma factor [Thermoanaerobaculia bacterium]
MEDEVAVWAAAVSHESEERALLAALRAGDDRAYERLVTENGGRMLAVARRMLRNDEEARDALQEAFLLAFRALPRFEGNSRISTWLHRIVVNASLMKLRSRRAHPEESIEPMLPTFLEDGHSTDSYCDWSESADKLLERSQVCNQVRASIDRLPETYRTVLLLRDIEELDTAEVAGMLGVSANAVKIRLHRARQALREQLDPHLRREDA